MISFEEAIQLVKNNTLNWESTQKISIHQALGQTLAQHIYADRDYPPFNRAAMDGYALKWEDAKDGIKLKVIGELHAGHTTDLIIQQGECIKIMTGSATPPSADLVVRVEDTQQEGDWVNIFFPNPPTKGQHLAMAGEDVQAKELLIKKGTHITHDVFGCISCNRPCSNRSFYQTICCSPFNWR